MENKEQIIEKIAELMKKIDELDGDEKIKLLEELNLAVEKLNSVLSELEEDIDKQLLIEKG